MLAKSILTLCSGALGLAAALPAMGQDDEAHEPTPVGCISMGRVRTTTVVDEQNILFYQRGGRIYLNILDQACLGLHRNGTFTYTVQSGARYVRLCDSDTITVLEPSGRGFSCGLGEFHPVSQLQAEAMLNPSEAVSFERAVVIEPVDAPEGAENTEGESGR